MTVEMDNLNKLQCSLLNILKQKGSLNRSEMVQLIGKPRTTIYDNLVYLIKHGFVKKFSRQVNSRGRPTVFFKSLDD